MWNRRVREKEYAGRSATTREATMKNRGRSGTAAGGRGGGGMKEGSGLSFETVRVAKRVNRVEETAGPLETAKRSTTLRENTSRSYTFLTILFIPEYRTYIIHFFFASTLRETPYDCFRRVSRGRTRHRPAAIYSRNTRSYGPMAISHPTTR